MTVRRIARRRCRRCSITMSPIAAIGANGVLDEPGLLPFRDVVTAHRSPGAQKPIGERTVIASMAQNGTVPQEGSVLVLGGPESAFGIQSILTNHCVRRTTLNDRGCHRDGDGARRRGWPCGQLPRVDRPGSVVTVLVCSHATGVGRWRGCFFYGWNSSCCSRMERWSPWECPLRAIVRRCVSMQAIPFGKWC